MQVMKLFQLIFNLKSDKNIICSIVICFCIFQILFFIPFYDNKFNSERLERLRTSMATECRLVPKASQPHNETTPILSKDPAKASPGDTKYTSSGEREVSPVGTGHGAIATGHGTIATGQYQETTPTKAEPSPAVLKVDAEPTVAVSEPVSTDAKTEAPAEETNSEQTPAVMDSETNAQISSIDPVIT